MNTYTFEITTSVPMKNGDVLKFAFPPQINVNGNGQATVCTPSNSDDTIICGISGNDIQITLHNLAPRAEDKVARIYDQTIGWTMTNIQNPPSLQESDKFKLTNLFTPDNYIVAQVAESNGVKNTEAAKITTPKLFQDSKIENSPADYTITFTAVNVLMETGSIVLQLPDTISLVDGKSTKCFVTTNKLFSSNCDFSKLDDERKIIITGVFETAAPFYD